MTSVPSTCHRGRAPPCRSISGSVITNQKSMEMSICRKESEDEQRMIKGKRKKVDLFDFIPDDILLDILKRVSDVFLRYKAKYVCRRWFNIITNSILLDHASFILQWTGDLSMRIVNISDKGEEGLQVKVLYPDIPRHIGKIRSWCNEFLLISKYIERRCLYVYNLITKEGSYILDCESQFYGSKCGMALSFDGFKGIYKVVHLYIGRTIECQILILKKDVNQIMRSSSSWKKIEIPYRNEGQYIYGDPVSVQGRYMIYRIHCSNDLVSVDTVKEEIRIISLPGSCDRGLFAMSGFLALIEEVSRDEVEVWVLKDFHRVTWEKLQTINGGGRYFCRYPGRDFSYHIWGMVSKRYLILKSMVGMYSYDLKSGVVKKMNINIQYTLPSNDVRCVFHSTAPSLK